MHIVQRLSCQYNKYLTVLYLFTIAIVRRMRARWCCPPKPPAPTGTGSTASLSRSTRLRKQPLSRRTPPKNISTQKVGYYVQYAYKSADAFIIECKYNIFLVCK